MKLIGFTPPSSWFQIFRIGDSVFVETIEHGELPGIVIGKDVRFYYPFDKAHETLTIKNFSHTEEVLSTRARPMFRFAVKKGVKR